jgi:hypothetical protein
MLVREVIDVLDRYVAFLSDQARNARDIGMWSGVVVLIFKEFGDMDGWWSRRIGGLGCVGLKRELRKVYGYGVKIMTSERVEIREALQRFMELIGDEYLRVE